MTQACTSETLRRAGVIADKIEDGTLFHAGIFTRAVLAETVRAVLEELQRLQAEVDRLRTEAAASPALRLIASSEVIADGPVRVTRLHLTEEGRAALTSKAEAVKG